MRENMNPIQLQTHAGEPARSMPTLPFMRRVLAQKHGRQQADVLAARFQATYDVVYGQRPVFTHKAMRQHVEANILVGLALYQTFLADGMSQATALNETQGLLTAHIKQGLARRANLLAHLPGTFRLLRWLAVGMMNSQFSAPGFEFHWIENSSRQIAFTITRCLYHNTLTAYGAPELTPVFCHLDDVWGAALAPKVLFERPQTIGRGGRQCDFCYKSGGLL
jgi:hypothetical protein